MRLHDEKHYNQIEEKRHKKSVVTPSSVKDFIRRGFENAEPGGMVFNYGHTRGYHGVMTGSKKMSSQSDVQMSIEFRKARLAKPSFSQDLERTVKKLNAANLFGLGLKSNTRELIQ